MGLSTPKKGELVRLSQMKSVILRRRFWFAEREHSLFLECRLMQPRPTPRHERLMLTVLGGRAEFERELIKSRTSEGRKRVRERGQTFWP
ncbi:recombinase family protein [Rhizobium rhizoryzae]|uniref:recombinase family protein n=1 Tax=Rhizobium rhizoryzae TaxID=451876 RepID=UPI0028A9EF10|nr:recombinase family protein [Rhizobium rhizoryzae]